MYFRACVRLIMVEHTEGRGKNSLFLSLDRSVEPILVTVIDGNKNRELSIRVQ